MKAVANRYIELTPQGAAMCVGGPASDVRGRLLQALLRREPHRAWQSEELAQMLPDERQHAPRALFQLQREGCIVVSLSAPLADERPWSAIQSDLESFIEEGATLAALLDADGLVIAQADTACPNDDPLVAPLEAALSIHVGEGLLAATYGLALRGLPAQEASSLVPLVRRLVRTRALQ